MVNRIYVGVSSSKREVFKCEHTPTEASHGAQYGYVIGPFRTMRGAWHMAVYGENNPHLLTVSDAERYAKIASEERESNIVLSA